MSVVRQLKPLNEAGYTFKNFYAIFPSGILFEIFTRYNSDPNRAGSVKGIEESNFGQIMKIVASYHHKDFPEGKHLNEIGTNLLEKHPRIKDKIKIYSSTALPRHEIPGVMKLEQRMAGVSFHTNPDIFFDDEYIQFLSEFEKELELKLNKSS